ncbi:heat shock factor 2-binding protein-like isoform X3 [Bacillus rossius redtenbacheri]
MRETKSLKENVEAMIGVQQTTKQAMELLHAECEGIKQKYRQLQLEWSSQQEHLGKMQSELYRLRGQIQLQSQFCASLGSVTGNLLWKCSRLPPVIDLLLSGNKLVDFLSLVSGSLQSFLETYGGDLPPTGSDECQFIMSLCGIVTNVAAAAAGRQFLATSERGRELLGQVVAVLPRIPVPAGNCFKRLLLMTLYNVSINQCGLAFLQESPQLLAALSHGLQHDTSPELKVMALRVLQSLSWEVKDSARLQQMEQQLPLSLIEGLSRGGSVDERSIAQDVLARLEAARATLARPKLSGDAQGSHYGRLAPACTPLTSTTSKSLF